MKEKGLELRFVQGWSTSWLELSIINPKKAAEAIEEIIKDEIEPTNIPTEKDDKEVAKTVQDLEIGRPPSPG